MGKIEFTEDGAWIDVELAIPADDRQYVKVEVFDFIEYYETVAYYDHRDQCWYTQDDIFLDGVTRWYTECVTVENSYDDDIVDSYLDTSLSLGYYTIIFIVILVFIVIFANVFKS